MALPSPYQNYQQQQVVTAPREKLLLMLFDGAIRFCNQALKAHNDKNLAEVHKNLIKVQKIMEELMATLDMNIEIAKDLLSLYDYLYRRLVEANLKKDPAIVEEVVGFLSDLRQTWAEAMQTLRRGGYPTVGGVGSEG